MKKESKKKMTRETNILYVSPSPMSPPSCYIPFTTLAQKRHMGLRQGVLSYGTGSVGSWTKVWSIYVSYFQAISNSQNTHFQVKSLLTPKSLLPHKPRFFSVSSLFHSAWREKRWPRQQWSDHMRAESTGSPQTTPTAIKKSSIVFLNGNFPKRNNVQHVHADYQLFHSQNWQCKAYRALLSTSWVESNGTIEK